MGASIKNAATPIVPCIALFLFLAGCAHSTSQGPEALAEKITRAAYAGNLEATVANFDDDLKKQAERTGLGPLSDSMHKLGEMKTISQRSADPDKGRYEYDATFERGKMLIELRLDPSGKVGAYRISAAK